MSQPVYALNLFDIASQAEYLAYSKRSVQAVTEHGGTVVALGAFQEAILGEIIPRSVMIVVEWASREAFDSYIHNQALADLHVHREHGAKNYIWHLFDKLSDLKPLLT